MRKVKGHAMQYRDRVVLGWVGRCQCGLALAGETRAELSAVHLVHRREVKAARDAKTEAAKAKREAYIASLRRPEADPAA